MDLIRDLLDKKLVDRNGREMGRVDGIVLELPEDAPPRVAALQVDVAVLARRIWPALAPWVEALEHAFGVDEGRPVTIRIAQVIDVHDHVKVNVAFGETAAADVEQRLRRWVAAIPGSS
jgi:hypothetical protein